MDLDIIFGCVIIFFGICFLAFLTFWSRWAINMIARKKLHTLREILKEFHT